jgi:hypothetical protein
MRGHRILTLFAVEAAAMFALCAAMSIPAASARAGVDRAVHGRAEDPSAASSVSFRVLPGAPTVASTSRPESSEHGDLSPDRSHSKNKSLVEVGVDQDNNNHSHSRSHSSSESHESHSHVAPPRFRHHAHAHVSPPVPHQHRLPVTGRSSTITALGGVAAILTGAALLWLSSVRRKRLPHPKSATGSAA